METLPAILCILIMAYIIYLEFKNPKSERDMFVDLSISIIILIVSIYSLYELHFDFTRQASIAYIVLILTAAFYIGLVVYNVKHPKKHNLKVVNTKKEETDANNKITSEEKDVN
jgi:CDP-diglyceride synthetase